MSDHPGEAIISVRGLVNRFGSETVHTMVLIWMCTAARFSASSAGRGAGSRFCCGPSSASTGRRKGIVLTFGSDFLAMNEN